MAGLSTGIYFLRKKYYQFILFHCVDYEIKTDDNIIDIAERHHIRWQTIACINHFKAPYILEAGQKSIAGFFFRHVEPKDGKFGNIAFELGANGAPIISDAPASVECDVVGFYELGDHSVVVGEVKQATVKRAGEPLTMKETGWNYGG